MIIGNFDGVFHGQVTGWVLHDKKSCLEEIKLIIDGKETETRFVEYERPDVYMIYGGEKKCGFKADINDLDKYKTYTVKLEHKLNGFDFNKTEIVFCLAVSNSYSAIKKIFYPEFYRVRNNLANCTNQQAWLHYFNCGIYKNYDPSPWFNNEYYKNKYKDQLDDDIPFVVQYLENEQTNRHKTSTTFCSAFYRESYQDLQDEDGLLGHYTGQGHFEGRRAVKRQLPQHLVEELYEISNIEPDVAAVSGFLSEIVRYPQLPSSLFLPQIVKQKYGQIDVAIAIPFISIGGADLLSTYLLKAFLQRFENSKVLFIVTDKSEIQRSEWISSDANILVLDDEVQFENHSERVIALHECLGELCPSIVMNVNSSVCWQVYKEYGKQLSTVSNLYSMLFCFDYDANNNKVGYITAYLRDCIEYLTGVLFDNDKIIKDIKEIYGFVQNDLSKFHCVYTPIPNVDISIDKNTVSKKYKILWQGRLCNQKRPDILVRLAKCNPHLEFIVFGTEGNSPYSEIIASNSISNITYLGTYSELSEIPFDDISVYLNTSAWDGIPTVILQMLAVGLPIVSSNVGGIKEVVSMDSCILIDDESSIDEYQDALNKMYFNYSSYYDAAQTYKKTMKEKYSWKSYLNQLDAAGLFDSNVARIASKNKSKRHQGA